MRINCKRQDRSTYLFDLPNDQDDRRSHNRAAIRTGLLLLVRNDRLPRVFLTNGPGLVNRFAKRHDVPHPRREWGRLLNQCLFVETDGHTVCVPQLGIFLHRPPLSATSKFTCFIPSNGAHCPESNRLPYRHHRWAWMAKIHPKSCDIKLKSITIE